MVGAVPRQILTTLIGKAVRAGMRLRGGGSALPGLVVEKIDRTFVARTLKDLPYGVVVISGTNGKTTTTKIVSEILEARGLKVFTNRTGSNFSRGVAAALLGEISLRGKLDADIAVLEMDEAWAVKFVQMVPPRYSLLLNVMRDQLDRFGQIDTTAGFLGKIAEATTGKVVLNRDDARVYRLREQTRAEVHYFGLTTELLQVMPTDDALKAGGAVANDDVPTEVLLTHIGNQEAGFLIDGETHHVSVSLKGVHNLLNAAAALSLVRVITPETPIETLLTALSRVQPAFGRGESIMYRGTPIDLLLAKNPSSFRLNLLSAAQRQHATMIAINDNYADGRDMSWLWDVDFSALSRVSLVTGARAHDMALRLKYDEVPLGGVEEDLETALDRFLKEHPAEPKQILCSYTAMLNLRKLLAARTEVEHIS
ncbi:Mur ligase family protein [Arachnia propionica]|uniref:Lipid II isoglutaminyl synthase (glutamine-hydrolyzing) subunit MurT n=1 Tax=Arachnia propionica TaxID=1750 RepID=A0A3P1WQZ0_9ACTN|nr:Mur ligase family protein [Arachnia propionica]